jgi:hypothetical protein
LENIGSHNGSSSLTHFELLTDVRCGLLFAEGRNLTAGLELSKLSQRFAEGKPLSPLKLRCAFEALLRTRALSKSSRIRSAG